MFLFQPNKDSIKCAEFVKKALDKKPDVIQTGINNWYISYSGLGGVHIYENTTK